jgi:hypothetical protein
MSATSRSEWQKRAQQMVPGGRIVGDEGYAARMPCRVPTMRLFEDAGEADAAFVLSRRLGFTCHGRCDELKWLVDPGPYALAVCCRMAGAMAFDSSRNRDRTR